LGCASCEQSFVIFLNLFLAPLTLLKDRFSSYPGIKEILAQAKADKAARKARLDTYYDDEKLAELAKSAVNSGGSNGVHKLITPVDF
jgi:hypothetical protein